MQIYWRNMKGKVFLIRWILYHHLWVAEKDCENTEITVMRNFQFKLISG